MADNNRLPFGKPFGRGKIADDDRWRASTLSYAKLERSKDKRFPDARSRAQYPVCFKLGTCYKRCRTFNAVIYCGDIRDDM